MDNLSPRPRKSLKCWAEAAGAGYFSPPSRQLTYSEYAGVSCIFTDPITVAWYPWASSAGSVMILVIAVSALSTEFDRQTIENNRWSSETIAKCGGSWSCRRPAVPDGALPRWRRHVVGDATGTSGWLAQADAITEDMVVSPASLSDPITA
jgi:hypothetical protein